MRKTFSLVLVACLLAVPALAGEVNTPGKSDPPPCTQNCITSTTTEPTVTDEMRQIALELIVALIKP